MVKTLKTLYYEVCNDIITKEDIERMKKDAAEHATDDKKRKERAKASGSRY